MYQCSVLWRFHFVGGLLVGNRSSRMHERRVWSHIIHQQVIWMCVWNNVFQDVPRRPHALLGPSLPQIWHHPLDTISPDKISQSETIICNAHSFVRPQAFLHVNSEPPPPSTPVILPLLAVRCHYSLWIPSHLSWAWLYTLGFLQAASHLLLSLSQQHSNHFQKSNYWERDALFQSLMFSLCKPVTPWFKAETWKY